MAWPRLSPASQALIRAIRPELYTRKPLQACFGTRGAGAGPSHHFVRAVSG